MDIEKRIGNLENLVNTLSKKIDRLTFYSNADTESERVGIGENADGVAENSACVLDVADLANENSICIEDLAEMIEDLEGRVEALEEKEA